MTTQDIFNEAIFGDISTDYKDELEEAFQIFKEQVETIEENY